MIDGVLAEVVYGFPSALFAFAQWMERTAVGWLVLEETGSQSDIEYRPLPEDDPKVRQPDISVAREVLGWEAITTLHEGLRKTIPYFRELVESGDARARTLTD